MIHQRHRQTDRQTDGQTTCDSNTALCTVVHRAVKSEKSISTRLGRYNKACTSMGVSKYVANVLSKGYVTINTPRPRTQYTVLEQNAKT